MAAPGVTTGLGVELVDQCDGDRRAEVSGGLARRPPIGGFGFFMPTMGGGLRAIAQSQQPRRNMAVSATRRSSSASAASSGKSAMPMLAVTLVLPADIFNGYARASAAWAFYSNDRGKATCHCREGRSGYSRSRRRIVLQDGYT
jgi:hypothetical protein